MVFGFVYRMEHFFYDKRVWFLERNYAKKHVSGSGKAINSSGRTKPNGTLGERENGRKKTPHLYQLKRTEEEEILIHKLKR